MSLRFRIGDDQTWRQVDVDVEALSYIPSVAYNQHLGRCIENEIVPMVQFHDEDYDRLTQEANRIHHEITERVKRKEQHQRALRQRRRKK